MIRLLHPSTTTTIHLFIHKLTAELSNPKFRYTFETKVVLGSMYLSQGNFSLCLETWTTVTKEEMKESDAMSLEMFSISFAMLAVCMYKRDKIQLLVEKVYLLLHNRSVTCFDFIRWLHHSCPNLFVESFKVCLLMGRR